MILRRLSPLRLIRAAHLRSTMIVFIGNGLSAGMGFAILALLTRSLTPVEFGTLSPIIAVLDTGQLLIDSVLVLGMLHVASKYAAKAPATAMMALKLGLWTKMAAGAVIGVCGIAGSSWLSELLLDTPEWRDELRLMFGAIIAVSTYTFVVSVLQTQERFLSLALVSLYKNGLRLVCVAAVLLFGAVTVTGVVWIYFAAAFASAALALMNVRPREFMAAGVDRAVLSEIFAVNKWMVLAAIGILGGRIDILMLTSMSTPDQVAWYTAAFQLCMVLGILSQALVTTIFPKTSKISSPLEVRKHVAACLKYVPAAMVFGGLASVASGWVIPLLLGETYAAAAMVFNLLLFSSLITLLMNPILLVFFPMNWSSMFGLASLLQLLSRVGLNFLLIGPYGSTGAAVADLASKLLVTAIMLGAVSWRVRRLERGVS